MICQPTARESPKQSSGKVDQVEPLIDCISSKTSQFRKKVSRNEYIHQQCKTVKQTLTLGLPQPGPTFPKVPEDCPPTPRLPPFSLLTSSSGRLLGWSCFGGGPIMLFHTHNAAQGIVMIPPNKAVLTISRAEHLLDTQVAAEETALPPNDPVARHLVVHPVRESVAVVEHEVEVHAAALVVSVLLDLDLDAVGVCAGDESEDGRRKERVGERELHVNELEQQKCLSNVDVLS